MLDRLADRILLRTQIGSVVAPVNRVSAVAPRDFSLGELVRAQVAQALPDGTFEVVIESQPFVLRLPTAAKPGDTIKLVVAEREPQLRFALAPRDFSLGEQVRAHVSQALPDGTFQVVIESQPFVLRLPTAAKAGDTVDLVVTGREPQLKFAVAPLADTPNIPTRLSDTARFITALLAESEKLPVTTTAPRAAPLLSGPPAGIPAFAGILEKALTQSGMFYESHQAQWIAGERPLAELLKEPQASLSPLPRLQALGVAQAESSAPPAPNEPDKAASELPVHRDALPIVRQQLDTLDSRNVAWTGFVWPGQELTWEIAEDSERGENQAQERTWQTRLRLKLPALGAVDAVIQLTPRGLAIELNVEKSKASETLSAHSASLRQALLDSGIKTLGIKVQAR